jgi:hypothetical protein
LSIAIERQAPPLIPKRLSALRPISEHRQARARLLPLSNVVSSPKTRGAVAAPVILWLKPKFFNLLVDAIPAQFFVDKVQAAQIHKNPYFRMA